jgi:hypothetical protein
MAQRTWMPRVASRIDIPAAPGDAERRPGVARRAAGADGDRAALRRARVAARAAAQAGVGPAGAGGWTWPHWLERQLDPRSPAFLPGGDLPFLVNLTQRDWTAIGNLDSGREATVDTHGLVTPWPGGWSLDWWVGADDRWHVPAREAAVRQRLVGGSPVVETAVRIPTGDAVHRAYAIRRSSAEGGGELVIVEVENRSKLPVALALAVRPYGPAGLAAIERVDLAEDGTALLVDGQVALLLPRPAARFAAAAADDGDSATVVLGGTAGERWPGAVRCPDRLAQAAVVFPLAHAATLRVAVPLVAARPARRPAGGAFPVAVPRADQVAAGWQAQGARGARVELPDGRLAEAVAATRRSLLLRHDGAAAVGQRGEAQVLEALDDWGYHDEVRAMLAGYPGRQRADGTFAGRDEPGATGAALYALGRHWRLARDRSLVDDMAEALARAAQAIEKARTGAGLRNRGPRRDEPALAGLLPAATGGEHAYADDLWAVAGLRACADVLDGIDQGPAAAAVGREAAALWADLERSLARTAERLGTAAIPAGPRRGVDAGAAESLAAAVALGVLAAGDPRVLATAEALRSAHVLDGGHALYDPARSGLAPAATLALARAELRAGDQRALDRLSWLLDAATGTWTWPGALHPRLGGGCDGDGHDVATAAAFLSTVRDLLVHEAVGDEAALALSAVVPGSWLGQGWEVHDAPTAHGTLSFAVRWHGERPALLWDLEAHDGVGPVRLTVPGLDPAWSTRERRGEALLAAVAPPGEASAPRASVDRRPGSPVASPVVAPARLPGPEEGAGPAAPGSLS